MSKRHKYTDLELEQAYCILQAAGNSRVVVTSRLTYLDVAVFCSEDPVNWPTGPIGLLVGRELDRAAARSRRAGTGHINWIAYLDAASEIAARIKTWSVEALMPLKNAKTGKEFIKVNQQSIVSASRSPTNSRRWLLTMSDGHTFWVTSIKKPKAKTTICAVCCGRPNEEM